MCPRRSLHLVILDFCALRDKKGHAELLQIYEENCVGKIDPSTSASKPTRSELERGIAIWEWCKPAVSMYRIASSNFSYISERPLGSRAVVA